MTFKELIDAVRFNTNTDEETTRKVIEETFQTIANVLEKQDRIQIPFFGIFETKQQKEREGINPQTKQKIKIPARLKIKFTPSKALKQRVEKHTF